MKRIGIRFLQGLFLLGIFASCLDSKDVQEPTREQEQLDLKKYIDNLITKGHDIDTTDLGVYYVTMDKGTGAFPKNGDTLTVGYAGYFPDGYLFDASVWHNQEDSTYTFVLGNPPLIKGWDDGMKVINKNARVQLIIPSDLAYGSSGGGIIPQFQTLVFVIIMKDIKPSI
jgi:FKBP-type peptidyl-prolyl cis-trans isomerase FkpA